MICQVKAEAGQMQNWNYAWLEFSCLLAKRLFSCLFQQVSEILLRTCANTISKYNVKKDAVLFVMVTLTPHLAWAWFILCEE